MARPGLLNHRKFRRLATMIGDDALALGSLEFIWAGAYESGDDFLGDAADVEIVARWRGESGKLFRALLKAGGADSAGFIEPIPGREGMFRVHDLWHHAPDYVRKRRSREAQRRLLSDPCPDRVQSVTGQSPVTDGTKGGVIPGDGLTLAPAPAPAPAPAQGSKDKTLLSGGKSPDGTCRDSIPYAEIISFLNTKARTAFKDKSKATRALISGRWREGNRIEQFRAVIENRVAKWAGDPKMREFLRPSTLFRASKFEEYLAAAGSNGTPKCGEGADPLMADCPYEPGSEGYEIWKREAALSRKGAGG